MVASQRDGTNETNETDETRLSQYPNFKTILRIFLIWELNILKLVFEMETGRDGRETDETVSKPRDGQSCNLAWDTSIKPTSITAVQRWWAAEGRSCVLAIQLGYIDAQWGVATALHLKWLGFDRIFRLIFCMRVQKGKICPSLFGCEVASFSTFPYQICWKFKECMDTNPLVIKKAKNLRKLWTAHAGNDQRTSLILRYEAYNNREA